MTTIQRNCVRATRHRPSPTRRGVHSPSPRRDRYGVVGWSCHTFKGLRWLPGVPLYSQRQPYCWPLSGGVGGHANLTAGAYRPVGFARAAGNHRCDSCKKHTSHLVA